MGRAPEYEGRALALEGRAPGHEGRALALEGRALALEGRAPGHEGRAPGLEGRAPGHEGRGPAREGRAPGYEGRAPEREGRAPGLEGRVLGLEGLDAERDLPAPEQDGPRVSREVEVATWELVQAGWRLALASTPDEGSRGHDVRGCAGVVWTSSSRERSDLGPAATTSMNIAESSAPKISADVRSIELG